MNLTPHPVVVDDGDRRVVVPPSGAVARIPDFACRNQKRVETDFGAVTVGERSDGPPAVLPDPEPSVRFIVSLALAQQARRPDLWFPFPLVRDDEGRVVACRGFAYYTERP